jgi:hypothetical protein
MISRAVRRLFACSVLQPGRATWDLPHLSGVLVLGIPIEDLLWYLYTAALWGTYYKFATGQVVSSAAVRRTVGAPQYVR